MADGLTGDPVTTPTADSGPFDEIRHLVDMADLDGLIRAVDASCASHAWTDVLRTRDLCRTATRTGRQVWPIATLCEYRLALWAPAEWASRVVTEDASRFSIGPLTEVIAQNHRWSDLNELLEPGPLRDIVAHERVIRGEHVDPANLNSSTLDLPFHLCSWEPRYTIAEYSDDGVVATCPADQWTHEWTEITADDESLTEIDDDETQSALRSLVEPWTAASRGRARSHIVEGGLESLAGVLNRSSLRVTPLSTHQTLDWLVWCGASSGAHGRRRGSAAGRFNAWWLVAALGGIDWDESATRGTLSEDVGDVLTRLDWFRIDSTERHSYELRLAAVEADEGITFGLLADDDAI